ncbi:isochorismatase family protein [Paenibacillus aurantius]|uniref:Isochorismatase family protein n=1 Tax=Paenibacillus aurantius TaxID=2918900 RepID=A0AA96L8X3_9BACL|nr:isochorismatase family protein [Paenibacillus aurantius]WNQ08850.1 isochorismatase family protein [Paenibacillus aurantius]
MKIAFLIIDMQKLFLDDSVDKRQIESACEYINYVSNILRKTGHPVVHIQDMEGRQHDLNPEVRNIIPQIAVEPDDLRVEKEYSNAFWQTNLEQLLRDRGVKFVVTAGFSAEYCVTFTTNGAAERGFPVAILQKGFLSQDPDAVRSVYRDRQVVSYSAIEFMAKACQGLS